MKLPTSGSARFKLGFFAVIGLFVLANIASAVTDVWPFGKRIERALGDYNEIGFPYAFWALSDDPKFRFFLAFDLGVDVVLWMIPAVAIGFLLRKFGNPNKHLAYLCKGCGYDLRGIELDVCPECGTAIARSSD